MRDWIIKPIVQEADAISPEAFRAQRMAELEQVAKYRAQKLRQYLEWSDPVKRAARQQQAADELAAAKEIFAVQEKLRNFTDIQNKLDEKTKQIVGLMAEMAKPVWTISKPYVKKRYDKKRKWYDFFGWFS